MTHLSADKISFSMVGGGDDSGTCQSIVENTRFGGYQILFGTAVRTSMEFTGRSPSKIARRGRCRYWHMCA